ncbi:hypothetical protein [Wenyingzhuangia sp. IMCC45574]
MKEKIAFLVTNRILHKNNSPHLKELIPDQFVRNCKADIEELSHTLNSTKNDLLDIKLDDFKKPYVEAFNDFFIKRYLPFESRLKDANTNIILTFKKKLEHNITKLDRNIVHIESILNKRLIATCSYPARIFLDFYMNCSSLLILLKQEEYRLAHLTEEDSFNLELLEYNYENLINQSLVFIQETSRGFKEGRLAQITFKNETNKLFDSEIVSFNLEYKDKYASTYENDILKQSAIYKKTRCNSVYDTYTQKNDTKKKYSLVYPVWRKEYESHMQNVYSTLLEYERVNIKPVQESFLLAKNSLSKLTSPPEEILN